MITLLELLADHLDGFHTGECHCRRKIDAAVDELSNGTPAALERLLEERDQLIAAGADPAELEVPLAPDRGASKPDPGRARATS